MSECTLEFALEAAAVEDIKQRIDVGTRLKLSDAGTRNGNLALEAIVFGQQRSRRWKLIFYTCLRQTHVSALANLNLASENTPFALPAGSLNL